MSNLEPKQYKSMRKEEWLKPENLKKIEEWAESGLIIENVAQNMGIAPSTFYMWKRDHQEFEEAWTRGKLAADTVILNSFFMSAKGYDVEEETKELDEYGQLQTVKVVKKHIPPNTTALNQWVKNRMPGLFKDNQLTDTYREKVKAETERIKLDAEKIRLQNEILKGVSKDTSKLDALLGLFENNEK